MQNTALPRSESVRFDVESLYIIMCAHLRRNCVTRYSYRTPSSPANETKPNALGPYNYCYTEHEAISINHVLLLHALHNIRLGTASEKRRLRRGNIGLMRRHAFRKKKVRSSGEKSFGIVAMACDTACHHNTNNSGAVIHTH